VDADAITLTAATAGRGHVDHGRRRSANAMERRGGNMGEKRPTSTGKYGGHPMRLTGRRRAADGEHTLVDRTEPTLADATRDCASAEAGSKEVGDCDDLVLPGRPLDNHSHPSAFVPLRGENTPT
jgi:hypothetical protein